MEAAGGQVDVDAGGCLSGCLCRLLSFLVFAWCNAGLPAVDRAGAVLPVRRARGRLATVAVNQFIFKQPVKVGDLLSFYAEITRVGNTSITVNVEVYAQRLRDGGEYAVKVTEATLTYVATDEHGKPRPVPPA